MTVKGVESADEDLVALLNKADILHEGDLDISFDELEPEGQHSLLEADITGMDLEHLGLTPLSLDQDESSFFNNGMKQRQRHTRKVSCTC